MVKIAIFIALCLLTTQACVSDDVTTSCLEALMQMDQVETVKLATCIRHFGTHCSLDDAVNLASAVKIGFDFGKL